MLHGSTSIVVFPVIVCVSTVSITGLLTPGNENNEFPQRQPELTFSQAGFHMWVWCSLLRQINVRYGTLSQSRRYLNALVSRMTVHAPTTLSHRLVSRSQTDAVRNVAMVPSLLWSMYVVISFHFPLCALNLCIGCVYRRDITCQARAFLLYAFYSRY